MDTLEKTKTSTTTKSLVPPLPQLLIEPLVRAALVEDLGRAGDLTTDSIVPPEATMSGVIAARGPGMLAGQDLAALAFTLVDPAIRIERLLPDGSRLAKGDRVMRISGPARGILTAERVALNFLCQLSGVATATSVLVEAVAGTSATICCTRKTTPTLRVVEKYAVRAGGGANHRFGLDDAVLIKDNHIAVAGGLLEAVRRCKHGVGHLVKIEVEVDTLEQLDQALTTDVDAILFDNMDPPTMAEAVRRVKATGRKILTEASGRINAGNAKAIAATGVDLMSSGAITHSAPIIDLGLDYD
jgi:nicotinate-nucleotide pyrophosphorylase (carboxylating)